MALTDKEGALDRLLDLTGQDLDRAVNIEILTVLHDIKVLLTPAPVPTAKPVKKAAKKVKK